MIFLHNPWHTSMTKPSVRGSWHFTDYSLHEYSLDCNKRTYSKFSNWETLSSLISCCMEKRTNHKLIVNAYINNILPPCNERMIQCFFYNFWIVFIYIVSWNKESHTKGRRAKHSGSLSGALPNVTGFNIVLQMCL